MLTKTTAIGVGAGCVIAAIGAVAFFLSLGVQSQTIEETLDIAENTAYQFNAPKHSHELLNVTGNSFHVKIETPEGEGAAEKGLQVDDGFIKNVSFEWFGLVEGQHRIKIQNTGDSEVEINGTFEFKSDPLLFTFHVLVIIAGIVIIGVSAGFSVKKPRGF